MKISLDLSQIQLRELDFCLVNWNYYFEYCKGMNYHIFTYGPERGMKNIFY